MENKTIYTIIAIVFLLSAGAGLASVKTNLFRINSDNYWNESELVASSVNNVLYVQAGNGSDIQAKINECPNEGVCEVIIPPGTYTLSSPILIEGKSFFHLKGSGGSTRIIVANSANLDYIIKFSRSSYSSISDVYIDGNKDNQIGGKGYGIYINESNRMIIDNVWIWNTYGDSMFFKGSSAHYSHAGQYSNIKILNSGGNAIYLGSYSYDSQFSNIWIGSSALHGIKLDSGANRFVNLHIWSSGEDGVEARTNENHFSNCYIESSSQSGFDIYSTSGTQITNCYIRGNAEKGVLADGASYTTVSNSKIIGNGYDGISTSSDSSHNMFIDNSIINNNATGILIKGKRNIVSNNQIINNSMEGIKVNSGRENIIEGNVIYNNGQGLIASYRDGINVIGASEENVISNNKIGDVWNNTQIKGIVLDSDTRNNFIYGNDFYNLTTPIQAAGIGNRYQLNNFNNHSIFDEIYIAGNEAKEIIFNSTDTTLANNACIGGLSINTNDASSSGTGEKGFIKFITDSVYGNGVKLIIGTSPTNKPYAITRMTISKEGRFGFGVDVNDSDPSVAFATFNGTIDMINHKIDKVSSIGMYAPNGTLYICGVDNSGTFSCS